MSEERLSMPIVGLGASAGGLQAFRDFLKHLPLDTGMGFVLVQHLDPEHESALTQLLARATSLPVHEVTDNARVEANHVYVIPPNTTLAIVGGVLKLEPRRPTRAPHRSIDSFFESLAQDQRERAIGVILSGTATDGTVGLEAIKAEGGITFAQDDSAGYDSMPRSAVAAGCVDFVLSPAKIAKELARIAKHPYVVGATASLSASAGAEDDTEAVRPRGGETPLPARGLGRGAAKAQGAEDGFKRVMLLLRNHSGVDFSLYKSTTIERRVARRLVLNKQATLADYARFLRGNAKELEALYSDALISVTSFFRNPEAFDVLRTTVLPTLLEQRGDEPLRVWVLGCSTGQEAYSIAMAFVEAVEKAPRMRTLQVFATDLNDALLDKARHGLYAKGVAQDVSPDRLRRFFVEEEGGYRVVKPLREMVVFARQNVVSDPPFSRLDLISCRNLMIYLEPGLQKKVLPVFHYALKPGGFLFLGASESIGTFTDLFEPVDKKHRFYSKKAAPAPALQLPVKRPSGGQPSSGPSRHFGASLPMGRGGEPPEVLRSEIDAQREADRVTVNQFAPPGVLINAELQILQFRGPTGAYLGPPTGKASFDVLKMAREGLMLPLRAAINKAKKENTPVRKQHVRIHHDGNTRTVNLKVIPLKNLRERCFLILFEDAAKDGHAVAGTPAAKALEAQAGRRTAHPNAKEKSRRISELETDLSETRDYLESLQEQHEAANEELQASNEEVQSANEELQSINEELETSKEELESANEELITVNEEMASRNTELNRLNNDLVNLQTSTQLAIVLLGRDLTIRRFSPRAEKQLNLGASDLWRPIGAVRHDLEIPDLETLISDVIDTVREREREVRDTAGRWFSLRVRPYLTLDNKVDGAVLVLVDIDDLKRSEQATAAAREYAEAIIRTTRDPLLILDADLRVDTANAAFYRTFNVAPAEAHATLIFELGGGQWDFPRLRDLLESIVPQNSFFNDLEVTHDFDTIGRRSMLLNARRLDAAGDQPARILLGIQDVTEVLQFQTMARQGAARYQALVEASAQTVWTMDSSGAVVEDSPSWRAFTGQTYAQWKGFGWLDAIHPDDRERVRELWERTLVERTPVETEYRLRYTSGEWRWTSVRIVPVLNPNGSVREWVGMNSDITERTRAEQALRESHARFEALFDASPVGTYLVDADFRIRQLSPAARPVFGDIGELIGRDFVEVIHLLWPPAVADEILARFRHTLETGEPYSAPEFSEERYDRKVREYYDWQIHRISLPDGQFGVVCYFIDISERLRLSNELRQYAADLADADRRKTEFLATLAHELRNPLAPIRNGLQIMRLAGEDRAAVQSASAMLERQVGQLVRLVDDLLDVSRIGRGHIALRRERVDLAALVHHAVEAASPLYRSRDQELTVTVPLHPLHLDGDPTRLTQVVGNLLSNAGKFTDEGGHVWLTVEREQDQAVLRVRDTGIGIPTDQLPHIFDMFRQGEAALERSQTGLGIGLSLVKKFVEMHDGAVEVRSAGVGQGSEFVVRLPLLAEPQPQPQPERSPEPAGGVASARLRILVVDDNRDSVESLATLLQLAGHDVQIAYDGLAAVDAVATIRPDVVLLDIGLPKLNGREVARRIRAQPWGRNIVLVALTGWGQEEDRRLSAEAGFNHHLVKPVDLAELTKLLAEMGPSDTVP